jgi:hypothetical protein
MVRSPTTMDLVLGGTGLKMGTDGFRRRGPLVSRLMHGEYGNWAERRPVLAYAVVAPLI